MFHRKGLILAATLFAALMLVGEQNTATAGVLVEDFEAAFPAWQSGWLGTNSNLENYYVASGSAPTERGNNPDGLWISDGVNSPEDCIIKFDPAFGATLTSLALDVAGYTATRFVVYDSSNAVILDVEITLTFGATSDPGVYANYSVNSTNGISGFSFLGGAIEGSTSIDNVVVGVGLSVVPEPSTLAGLGLGGLAALAGLNRKRRAAR